MEASLIGKTLTVRLTAEEQARLEHVKTLSDADLLCTLLAVGVDQSAIWMAFDSELAARIRRLMSAVEHRLEAMDTSKDV